VQRDTFKTDTRPSDGRFRSDWPWLRGFAGVLFIIHCGWNAPAVGAAITPVIPDAARPLPLGAVRLTGGPLKHAQDLNARYLLALEPDRMLAGYRIRAGLEPKAKGYGGWDSVEGKQLTGHVAGHYLSAVSLMYAVTGDARFKERADYMVRELKEVQQKRGNGYLGAITDSEGTDAVVIFERVAAGDIRSGGFDLNGMWSPWYTLHKTYAGLRDAYRFTGNRTALELELGFAAWAEGIVSRLSDSQVQRMLNTEFGGMNEIFADLYADTGDRRWLELSTSSSIARSRNRSSATRTTSPVSTATRRFPSSSGRSPASPTPATSATVTPPVSSGTAWCSITAMPPAVMAKTNTLASRTV
jgi:hypothetical protein